MFVRIMAPVDLGHIDQLRHALDCAADLAAHYNVPVTYVGVTASGPGSMARNPEEFDKKLTAFVKEQADSHGVDATAHTVAVNDPVTEIDDALIRAIDETGADLVVMGSHVPGLREYLWPSNGGKLAAHAKCSVMLVKS